MIRSTMVSKCSAPLGPQMAIGLRFSATARVVIRHYYVRAQALTLQCVHTGGVSPRVVGSPLSAPHSRTAEGTGIACRPQVGARLVVIAEIRGEGSLQMAGIQDDQMVYT